MVVLKRKPMEKDSDRSYELQLGWPSWDPSGADGHLAVRVEIRDANGKFLRSSPEMPVEWIPKIVEFLQENKKLGLAVGAVV